MTSWRPYDQQVVSVLDSECQRLAAVCQDRPEGDPVRAWHFRRLLMVRATLDRYVESGTVNPQLVGS